MIILRCFKVSMNNLNKLLDIKGISTRWSTASLQFLSSKLTECEFPSYIGEEKSNIRCVKKTNIPGFFLCLVIKTSSVWQSKTSLQELRQYISDVCANNFLQNPLGKRVRVWVSTDIILNIFCKDVLIKIYETTAFAIVYL